MAGLRLGGAHGDEKALPIQIVAKNLFAPIAPAQQVK
jgi:hypothetical protein